MRSWPHGDFFFCDRAGRTNNLDRLESDVSEVTHLLKENVEKVVDRGERIDDLQTRSGEDKKIYPARCMPEGVL